MEEKKIVQLKKEEFAIREYIKSSLGKGKISKVKIEYTPMGERIIIYTHKPGMVIGKGGAKIEELTNYLKKKFKFENPHLEISEISEAILDATLMADEIAVSLEKFGPLKFKVIAYKALSQIIKAGALGAEIRLNGKLPSARAKPWRFHYGYLKKTGDSAKVVDRAKARAETKPGTVGIKVSILKPETPFEDKIIVDESLINRIKENEKELNKGKEKKKK